MNLKDAGIYDMINIFKGEATKAHGASQGGVCLLCTSPSPRDVEESRMPSSA